MNTLHTLHDLEGRLAGRAGRCRVAALCATDASTLEAVDRALAAGWADFLFVGREAEVRSLRGAERWPDRVAYADAPADAEAAALAARLVREGRADVLMKGLISSDVMLRAVLDKEHGLLPAGGVLTHVTLAQVPAVGRLFCFSDAAVMPRPTDAQRERQVEACIAACRAMGMDEPRVALVHCSEHVSEKFPHTLHYRQLAAAARDGRWGRAVVDGPLDLRTALDAQALAVKGIDSPVGGRADALVFPDIVSANTLHKALSLLTGATLAGVVSGAMRPVVLPSRGDDADSKYYSLVLAALL